MGRFTIHGVTLDRTFDAVVLYETDGIRLKSSLPMNLKDYQIRGLSKFLGTIKMHPDIVVHVDLLFAPGAQPTNEAPVGQPGNAS
jgi:hypothetical protein